mmetsp:Transcript_100639/g.267504  ORF Transcript_100639/g.267504 Transcript_100639/m.267504 type:complete len:270 (-) Transcript_100639:1245-2054(-)
MGRHRWWLPWPRGQRGQSEDGGRQGNGSRVRRVGRLGRHRGLRGLRRRARRVLRQLAELHSVAQRGGAGDLDAADSGRQPSAAVPLHEDLDQIGLRKRQAQHIDGDVGAPLAAGPDVHVVRGLRSLARLKHPDLDDTGHPALVGLREVLHLLTVQVHWPRLFQRLLRHPASLLARGLHIRLAAVGADVAVSLSRVVLLLSLGLGPLRVALRLARSSGVGAELGRHKHLDVVQVPHNMHLAIWSRGLAGVLHNVRDGDIGVALHLPRPPL